MSGYEDVSVQIFAKGIPKLRIGLVSHGLTAFCEHCTINWSGVIAVDNIVFEK